MALTSTTTTDIVGATQVLTYSNPSQIDQISFGSNQITFGTTAGYSLGKSDQLLFNQFLNTFNNLLLINFPTVASSINAIWPLCSFDITFNNIGTKKIAYAQTSIGTSVFSINYLPIAVAGAVAARGSPVTISLQEYFSFIVFMAQYTAQTNLN